MASSADANSEYRWNDDGPACIHRWVRPALVRLSDAWPPGCAVFDIGCGNGYLAAQLERLGFRVTGIDPSTSGVAQAREAHPDTRFEVGSAYDDLGERFGRGSFDVVVSVDVVEHLLEPRRLVRNAFDLLKPGGHAVVVTPYHGYAKNLALALAGRWDWHFTALWDGGHVKFWSRRTLTQLLQEPGFRVVSFQGLGRLPYLWKSMLLVAQKPVGAEGTESPATC